MVNVLLSKIDHSRLKIGTPIIFLSISILALLSILLDVPILRQSLGIPILLIIPGVLITRLLHIKTNSFWEYLVLAVGFSLVYVFITGLMLNETFRLLRIPYPLSSENVLWVFFVPIIAMIGIHAALIHDENPHFFQVKMTRFDWVAVSLCLECSILGAMGAMILNNGGSSIIAVTNLVIIALYVFLVTVYHKDTSADVLAISIILISLSLLLSYSMRSWHIAGWDIHQEFYVFQLNKTHQEWNIQNFPDPYNACLSITILPTVFSYILGINDEFIYKVFYQVIFSIVPLVIYLTARKYVPSIFAFLSSMFFIFQPWFIQPSPALARQEIGLLFFALFVWSIFSHHFTKYQKLSMQVVFGTATILSHYSTAYIMLLLITVTYLTTTTWKLIFRKKIPGYRGSVNGREYISLSVLIFLFAFTFFWSNIFTKTSGNVYYVFQLTLTNAKNILLSDLRSEDFRMALLGSEQQFTIEDVKDYIALQKRTSSSTPNLFPPETFNDFEPRIVLSDELQGIITSPLLQDLVSGATVVAKQLTKVLLVLGAFLGIWYIRQNRHEDNEYVFLNIASVCILFVFMILPVLSLYYNLFRIYLQMLVISSVSIVLGFCYLFGRFQIKNTQRLPICLLIILFFFSTNGALNYVVGGSVRMNLGNTGEEYDKFFTHEQEVVAARWLAGKRDPNLAIFADETASLRLISFGNGIVKTNTAILPFTITKGSYVYLDYSNALSGITRASFNGKQISYNYPIEFIDQNKSLIYDSGGARIYK